MGSQCLENGAMQVPDKNRHQKSRSNRVHGELRSCTINPRIQDTILAFDLISWIDLWLKVMVWNGRLFY
ncbi:hypothetical protein V6N12_028472 [Hibiscus sabdariffa]|uniref:Uncharacterized protein n=1 Tax=Hibiscus sabdariffa TaxID=183260 RepID=A0ABR2F5X8_9ROSI